MGTQNGLAWTGANGAMDNGRDEDGMCHDDSAAPVRANTVDELHSLQRKRGGAAAAAPSVVEERHKLQLQSISASLASLTLEIGPKLVKGDPARETDMIGKATTNQLHHHFTVPTIGVSDSDLKFTHVLYNLSPSELYEHAVRYEKGSFFTSNGALATLSGAKTGQSPRDKHVVKDDTADDELWWERDRQTLRWMSIPSLSTGRGLLTT